MKKIFALTLLTLALGACAPKTNTLSPVGVAATAFDKNNWVAQGKIGMAYPSCNNAVGECSRKSMNGNLRWEHRPDHDLIQVFDPLGKEHLGMTYQTNGMVEIREPNKAPQTMTLQQLSAYLTIPLPLDKLPQLLVDQRNEEKFEFNGWKVENTDWQGHYYRAVRLRQNDYFIKIVVNEMGG